MTLRLEVILLIALITHTFIQLLVFLINKIAFLKATSSEPTDIMYGELQGEKRQLTKHSQALIKNKNFKSLKWHRSSYDGKKVQGFMLKPPNFDAKKKYPLVILHAEAVLSIWQTFSLNFQLFASLGYVVYYPNFRQVLAMAQSLWRVLKALLFELQIFFQLILFIKRTA